MELLLTLINERSSWLKGLGSSVEGYSAELLSQQSKYHEFHLVSTDFVEK